MSAPSLWIARWGFSPARRVATGISCSSNARGTRNRFWYSRNPLLTQSGRRVPAAINRHFIRVARRLLVSCPTNNLLDPPVDFRAGQGAPTSHSGHYGEEAQRRPARKDTAQRVSYWWDRTLAPGNSPTGAQAPCTRRI